MSNGFISDAHFAEGSLEPLGDSYLNGRYVGSGMDVDLWDLYNMAESGLETLLDASWWSSDQLNLTGRWIDWQTMYDLLEQYAQV